MCDYLLLIKKKGEKKWGEPVKMEGKKHTKRMTSIHGERNKNV